MLFPYGQYRVGFGLDSGAHTKAGSDRVRDPCTAPDFTSVMIKIWSPFSPNGSHALPNTPRVLTGTDR